MNKVKTLLSLHERELSLLRFPERSNETLQAWDAGDEYLINHIETQQLPKQQNILILNDHFGALSCWFSEKHNITMMSDSFISHHGTKNNLQRNNCPPVQFLSALDKIPPHIDLVLLQIPKNNRLLSWQLYQLRSQLPTGCPVIAVNKAKDIHTSTLKLFEKYLGETKTSLAWKKHRLIFGFPNSQPITTVNPITEWAVDGEGFSLQNYPNTYSGESLDLGARFMLKYLPSDPKLSHIIDLGCGNGVLSVKIGLLNPQAKITCVDESFMALESAKKNVAILGHQRNVQFIANNCLDSFDEKSADLVICNPPFHQNNAITDHIAWQMFYDTKHTLRHGGKLLVIGNRHLDYNAKLSKLFGRSQVIPLASNNKFVILQAIK